MVKHIPRRWPTFRSSAAGSRESATVLTLDVHFSAEQEARSATLEVIVKSAHVFPR